jgi:beta-phosphoglucomutase-like phosphatase (HAD superfamily)
VCTTVGRTLTTLASRRSTPRGPPGALAGATARFSFAWRLLQQPSRARSRCRIIQRTAPTDGRAPRRRNPAVARTAPREARLELSPTPGVCATATRGSGRAGGRPSGTRLGRASAVRPEAWTTSGSRRKRARVCGRAALSGLVQPGSASASRPRPWFCLQAAARLRAVRARAALPLVVRTASRRTRGAIGIRVRAALSDSHGWDR